MTRSSPGREPSQTPIHCKARPRRLAKALSSRPIVGHVRDHDRAARHPLSRTSEPGMAKVRHAAATAHDREQHRGHSVLTEAGTVRDLFDGAEIFWAKAVSSSGSVSFMRIGQRRRRPLVFPGAIACPLRYAMRRPNSPTGSMSATEAPTKFQGRLVGDDRVPSQARLSVSAFIRCTLRGA